MCKTLVPARLAAPLMILSISASAADAVGRGQTINRYTSTHAANGTRQDGSSICGSPARRNPICAKCKDDFKNKPISGVEVIRALEAEGANQ